jgi:hypothetical protein
LTLFRVMLAGNPALFVPQELALLSLDRLDDTRMLPHGAASRGAGPDALPRRSASLATG